MHNLCSLFDIINFGDKLKIRLVQQKNYFRCNLPIPQSHNLLYKAFTRFVALTDFQQGVSLEVEKLLPYGSGLGAGSAQAAYLLDFLNRQLEVPLDFEDLLGLAAGLGCDVPVFFSPKPQFVMGQSTDLEPLAIPPLEYVVMIPEWQGDTTKLFASPNFAQTNRAKSSSFEGEGCRFAGGKNGAPRRMWQ